MMEETPHRGVSSMQSFCDDDYFSFHRLLGDDAIDSAEVFVIFPFHRIVLYVVSYPGH